MSGKFSQQLGPASFQPCSNNSKLSHIHEYKPADSKYVRVKPTEPYCCSTYVSIEATCPDLCPFKGRGCYVQAGWTMRAANILDSKAAGMTGDEVIEKEVELIDSMFPAGVPQDGANGGRDLRLHIGGDTTTPRATRWLAAAASRWLDRGGGEVWAYTHRWREVPAASWGAINVFASVETIAEADLAWARGYAVAITVVEFKEKWKHRVHGEDGYITIQPCPAQTGKAVCVRCRLCLGKLKGQVAIGFALHGTRVAEAKRVLAPLEQMRLDLGER